MAAIRLALCSTLLVALGGPGCASSHGASELEADEAFADAPIQLPLTLASGDSFDLARLRGKPALVFLFATYDAPSQLALEPLTKLHTERPELQVIGIAVQPDAETFLPAYASALDVRFALAFDPSGNLLKGATTVGAIPAVPCYLLIDAMGRIHARRVGPLNRDELDDFVEPVIE